jgi:hypothetical protein
MPFPTEADSRISEELSEFIEPLTNNPDIEALVTLGFVRDILQDTVGDERTAEEPHRFGNEESLYAEVVALIEEYGEDVLAIDFIIAKASDELSWLIEALIDASEEDVTPTLGSVRAAITAGLAARLVGEGAIEADEEQTLLAEIDVLINHYGEDLPAENLLRFG